MPAFYRKCLSKRKATFGRKTAVRLNETFGTKSNAAPSTPELLDLQLVGALHSIRVEAINKLNFKGVQIYTPMNDRPLDDEAFFPLYEKACYYNLPILLHPQREGDYPDYRTEKASKYTLSSSLGWPYETTTAIYGYTPGLMCGYAFFGAQHLLFGTDMPFDSQFGLRWTRETIDSIDRMDISHAEKKMIFEDNARRLFRLTV